MTKPYEHAVGDVVALYATASSADGKPTYARVIAWCSNREKPYRGASATVSVHGVEESVRLRTILSPEGSPFASYQVLTRPPCSRRPKKGPRR